MLGEDRRVECKREDVGLVRRERPREMPQGNVRHFGIAINRVETGADIVRLGLQYVGEHFVYGRLVFHLREAGYVEALREGMKFDFRVPDQAFARST